VKSASRACAAALPFVAAYAASKSRGGAGSGWEVQWLTRLRALTQNGSFRADVGVFASSVRLWDKCGLLHKKEEGLMWSGLKYALVIAVLFLLASIPMAMQRERGSIQGLITNNRGPLAKASVEARNVMSGAVTRTRSDAAGHYRLENLPEGRYSLWVTAAGHDSTWVREIVVDHNRITHYDIRLAETDSPAQSGRSTGLPGASARS